MYFSLACGQATVHLAQILKHRVQNSCCMPDAACRRALISGWHSMYFSPTSICTSIITTADTAYHVQPSFTREEGGRPLCRYVHGLKADVFQQATGTRRWCVSYLHILRARPKPAYVASVLFGVRGHPQRVCFSVRLWLVQRTVSGMYFNACANRQALFDCKGINSA